ncbi:MAG: cytochrome c nitrite reductase small subunit [Planctomycetota bacterium]|nr:MAG: cytochrome c nitrite reductase small subunit [Planctomycetota bacterium]
MGETSATKHFPRAWLLLALMAGGALGLGGYTFHYAEGTSYLSTDPKACVNCHIMRPQYDSWQKASHHISAGCVDCHLPASGIEKWIAKADNGYRHSKAFTFQDFPEPIRITPGNAEILQNNCVRCHSDLVHELAPGVGGAQEAVSCVHCHSSVGHGVRAGLGGRDLGIEAEMR